MPKKGRKEAGATGRRHYPPKRPKIGDRVRIVDVSADLKAANYDMKSSARQEMRTAELFQFCVDRVFRVYGFDRYGNVELRVSNSSAVRKKFGKWHTIWCEPKFVKLVKSKRLSS